MKKIAFIGAYDKIDFVIYVAKVLTAVGRRVLVVDGTVSEKTRYIVPCINPTKSYVTDFEGIDVSVGFQSYEDIKKYLGTPIENELDYDAILFDIDNMEGINKFNIETCEKNYFVTSFDLYSLKKGLEILNEIQTPIKLTKILFSKDILKEENEYLNFLSLGKKIIWNENYAVYFPIDNGDQSVIIENQRVGKIGVRKLSSQYKESLGYIVEDAIEGDVSSQEVKRALKLLEKEV